MYLLDYSFLYNSYFENGSYKEYVNSIIFEKSFDHLNTTHHSFKSYHHHHHNIIPSSSFLRLSRPGLFLYHSCYIAG